MKDNWISIDERLPDYDISVLWYSEDGLYHVEDLDKDGNPWLYNDPECPFQVAPVTHWQPLPEPPMDKKLTNKKINKKAMELLSNIYMWLCTGLVTGIFLSMAIFGGHFEFKLNLRESWVALKEIWHHLFG